MNRGVKAIFWGVQIAFALISGFGEALIYQAYSPSDWIGTFLAFMRAGGMQLMIVMFGFAAVQASKNRRRGLVWLANILALGFSFISFWFIRESSIAEAHVTFLQAAYNQPLTIPTFWGTVVITGQGLDPNLIGCIPFIQTALNWFAPVITNDTKVEYVESMDEMQERLARDLILQEHKNRKRALGASGAVGLIGTVTKATIANVTGKDATPHTVTEPSQPTDEIVDTPTVPTTVGEFAAEIPVPVGSTIHRLSEEYQDDGNMQNGHSQPNAVTAPSDTFTGQPARVERREVGAIGTIAGAPAPRNQRKAAAHH